MGSTKICGVKRRDRLPSEGRASVRGRRLDVQPSMSATLTPRILVLPNQSGGVSNVWNIANDAMAELRKRPSQYEARRLKC